MSNSTCVLCIENTAPEDNCACVFSLSLVVWRRNCDDIDCTCIEKGMVAVVDGRWFIDVHVYGDVDDLDGWKK